MPYFRSLSFENQWPLIVLPKYVGKICWIMIQRTTLCKVLLKFGKWRYCGSADAAVQLKVTFNFYCKMQESVLNCYPASEYIHTVFQKSDAKIQITITTAYLIRINYPLSSFNYRLSGTNIANFNKIHHMVSGQRLFKKWNSKTEVSNMEKSP